MAWQKKLGKEHDQEGWALQKCRAADELTHVWTHQCTIMHVSQQDDHNITRFLELPSKDRVRDCHRQFYGETSNAAVTMSVCGVCTRELGNQESKMTTIALKDIPNPHLLVPPTPHPAHTLFLNMLLEPTGVHRDKVAICTQCLSSLQSKKSCYPPRFSLANNLWIGEVPWQLKTLTFPEQLLIALLYPRVYIFKLFSKRFQGCHNTSTFQCGMCSMVSTYALSINGIASMIQGKFMPHPPAVLASVISVTFIGLGQLPQTWPRNTFRVRHAHIHEALQWLKNNNLKYYSEIEISHTNLLSLPEDNVPVKISDIIRQSSDSSIVDIESAGYVPHEDEEATAGKGEFNNAKLSILSMCIRSTKPGPG